MKKLFTLAALFAGVWCGASAEDASISHSDVIDYAGLAAQNTDLKYHESNDPNPAIPYGDAKFTSDNGSVYSLVNVWAYNAEGDPFFVMAYPDYPAPQGHILLTTPIENEYICSVNVSSPVPEGNTYRPQYNVFYGLEPFDWSDRWNQHYQDYVYANEDVALDYPAKYVLITCTQNAISSVTVNWSATAPVPSCKKPDFYWSDVVTGRELYVSLPWDLSNEPYILKGTITDGEAEVEVDWNYAENDGRSFMYKVTGRAGETLSWDLYYTAEGYDDSEHVTGSCNIEMPQAQNPRISAPYPFLANSEVTITAPVDYETQEPLYTDATIYYTVTVYDWDNGGPQPNPYTGYGQSPITFNVSELGLEYTVGNTIGIEAYISVPDYKDSSKESSWNEVVSSKLSAPTFSVEDGATVEAGSELQIIMPNNGQKLHYTINGGEEQVSEGWVYLTITEDTVVEAWATREGMETSDKATLNVKVEAYGRNVDILTYGVTGADQVSSNNLYNWTSENTGISYDMFSGIWNQSFYMQTRLNPFSDTSYIANGENANNKIKAIRIDQYDNYSLDVTVFFANEPLNNESEGVQSNLLDDIDYDVMVISSNSSFPNDNGAGYKAGAPGEWINLEAAQAAAEEEGYELRCADYTNFYIRSWNFGNTNYVRRVLIEYEKEGAGVEGIEDNNVSEADAVYYNLNGIRVDKANLAPGLYIRVAGTEATKVLVK